MSDDDLMTVRQAARYLGVHENTVRNWADKGLLPVAESRGILGYRVFSKDDLDKARPEARAAARTGKIAGSPSRTDRAEAAHWARDARSQLTGWLGAIENFDQFPILSYNAAVADLDDVSEKLRLAKRALRGKHTRGATSRLTDLGS